MIRLQWRRLRSKYPWIQMIQNWRCWLLVLFVVLLVLYTILAFKKTPVPYMQEEIREIRLGQMEFDFQTGLYFLSNKKDKTVYLRGSMPDILHIQMNGPPSPCAIFNASKEFCAMWYGQVKLEVVYSQDQHASCYSVAWQPTTQDYQPQTCFSLADYKWYGGSLLHDQTWPLNSANVPFQPYTTQDLRYYTGVENVFGNVLDWFWISSAGIAIMIDNSFPIHVSVNQSKDNLLCLYSTSENRPSLKYKICKSDHIRKIHRYVISQMVTLPKSLPSREFFSTPFWSTSPYFNDSLDQDKLHKFGVDINDRNFPGHILEMLDSSLTVCRKIPFDKKRFSNIHQVVMYLHDYKFKVYMPVSPFVSTHESWNKSRLMVDSSGNALVTTWNDQDVNLINLLESKTFEWFIEELQTMKTQFGLDGFRLLGGESVYLTIRNINSVDINKYSMKLSHVMEALKQTSLSSFGSRSQPGAHFIVLSSVESSWGTKGGLASVIPSVFTLGLLGYPFVIPNVIGGPGQKVQINTSHIEYRIPDRELYIRWMGLSAFMPGMMFSVPPWSYDDQVMEIAQQFVKIHEEVASPSLMKAAREYEISGSPIVRPLWWSDPTDKIFLTICDEYLIGDEILVAPIIVKGATKRDIYIPEGTWRDELRGENVIGKDWLKDYKIELGQVAYFTRQVNL